MRFLQPELLWLYLLFAPLALTAWWSAQRRRSALRRFAGGGRWLDQFRDEVSSHRRAAKLLLLYVSLAAAILAAARPQWGTRLEPITRRGVDLVIVLDTSLSMAADDLAPSRLAQAKHQIDRLLQEVPGNRVALVTFAGQSTLLCPLTLDHSAVRLFLDSVDVESVQVPGTAMAEALRLAVSSFGAADASDQPRTRALLLFTDGEDHEGQLEQIPRELKQAGIGLYAIGCGSTRGAPIPLRDRSGLPTGYKKDREGKVVTTRLDEGLLETLALDSGGRYFRATAGGQELDQIVQTLSGLDSREYGSVLRTAYEDRFQVPLSVALLALLVETLIGDRRRRGSGGAPSEGRA